MDNNTKDVQISISDVTNVVKTSLQRKESAIPYKPKCCIYTVPEFTQRGIEDCYRPLVISIGPIFYNNPKLKPLQELKLIMLKSFREHPDNAFRSLEPYIDFVREKEEEIRECYQAEIRFSSVELIEMIVLDAIFLIYLFLLFNGSDDRLSSAIVNSFKSKLLLQAEKIDRDLYLMENQIPFFVLEGIYDIAFSKVCPRLSIIHLALEYMRVYAYGYRMPNLEAIKSIIHGNMIPNTSTIKHLLDLRMKCCCLSHIGPRGHQMSHEEYKIAAENYKISTAEELSAAGVKFMSIESDDQFGITFNKSTGELKIPKVLLYDNIDALYRSLNMFEQFEAESSWFYDYLLFFDQLIDSVEDVQILQQNEILQNNFGSDQDVVNLFDNLLKNIPMSGHGLFSYSNVKKDLKDFTSRSCNRWKAILWSRYFNHPWAIISVIAAVMLFILTLLQTISGFISK